MTRLEKRQIKGGDKSILYEKLGLLEEKDLKNYYSKFGIKNAESLDEEELKNELMDKTTLGKKGSRSRFKRRREASEKEHLVNMFSQ